MAVITSTGARDLILSAGFKPSFQHCAFLLISGTPPVNPDLGLNSGSQVVAVLADDPAAWVADGSAADGITWQDPANGRCFADTGLTLFARGIATGVATFAWLVRDVAGGDGTGASTSIARIQCSVGVNSGDMRVNNASFSSGSLATVDPTLLSVGFPPLPTV